MSDAPIDANKSETNEVVSGTAHYRKCPYAPPQQGMLYSVRDKSGADRIVQVVAKSGDGLMLQVATVENGKLASEPLQIPAEALARQAEKGWCSLLLPIARSEDETQDRASKAGKPSIGPDIVMRLDSQNFGRCCADIARANIKFSTQLIKDVCDGPFRAGDYQQAFLSFEQLSVGFNSAVGNSRRAIAEGRRKLTAEKRELSGKEIQERSAAFLRSEQLIHTAEREFATILEGLRMYLRANQNQSAAEAK